jgi:hypothetical protein
MMGLSCGLAALSSIGWAHGTYSGHSSCSVSCDTLAGLCIKFQHDAMFWRCLNYERAHLTSLRTSWSRHWHKRLITLRLLLHWLRLDCMCYRL